MRYGDDFILFCRSRQEAQAHKIEGAQWLENSMGLYINPKNDIVVRASSGLHFLGHHTSAQEYVVDPHTTRSVLQKTNITNIASYKSLQLSQEAKKQLDWIILPELF